MQLLDIYKAILKTANLECNEEGLVSFKLAGESKPALIKDKRLVLPTAAHLANPLKQDIVIFHPLSENVVRGESDVVSMFRSTLNLRFNFTIGLLAYELLSLATSPANHNKLNPDQSILLSKLKNADEKTLDVFQKLLKEMPASQTQKCFVNLFLKRGGSVGGKKYSRAGIVSFPLYEELMKAEPSVYGIKLRAKDKETFIALLEYLFPSIGVEGSYSRGSNSTVAPFLDSLMKSVLGLASPLNDTVELFSNVIDNYNDLIFEGSWVESFENIDTLLAASRSVPMQHGNEGSGTAAAAVASAINVPVPAYAAPAAPQPVQFVAPTLPAAPAVPMQQVYQPAQQTYPYPVAQQQFQPVMHQQPQLVRTANGVDFNSLMNLNPALSTIAMNTGGQRFHNNQPMQDPTNRSGMANMGYNPGYNNGYPMNNGGGYNNGGNNGW